MLLRWSVVRDVPAPGRTHRPGLLSGNLTRPLFRSVLGDVPRDPVYSEYLSPDVR